MRPFQRSVSVVIPNYNGEKLLEKNLPSIFKALEFAKLDYEVIIPDDHSKDDSISFLKKNYPSVVMIEAKTNLGFSGNINRGIRVAQKELVCLLNTDIELCEDYFIHQAAYFEDPKVFAVMGAIYDTDSSKLCQLDLSVAQNMWGYLKATKIPNYDYKKPITIYAVSGSNALVDRKKLETLDFFNELFSPYYGEDIELSLRAWRHDWKCVYEPRSHCFHQGSSTIKSSSSQKKIRLISRRNKMIYHALHLQGFHLILFCMKTALDLLTRALIFDFQYYRAFNMFFQEISTIQRSRKTNQYQLSTLEALDLIKKHKQP